MSRIQIDHHFYFCTFTVSLILLNKKIKGSKTHCLDLSSQAAPNRHLKSRQTCTLLNNSTAEILTRKVTVLKIKIQILERARVC